MNQSNSGAASSPVHVVSKTTSSAAQCRPYAAAYRKPRDREGEKCANCGRTGHRARDLKCPALGKTCNKCHKQNHFASMCRSSVPTRRQSHTPTSRSHSQAGKGKAHQVADQTAANEDDGYAFNVGATTASTATSHKSPRVEICIGNAPTTAIIDSGASCNLLGSNHLKKLQSKGLSTSLRPCHKDLYAYGSTTTLPLLGQFTAPTTVHNRTVDTTFVVINGPGDILLRRESAEQFEVITFRNSLAANAVSADDEFRCSLLRQYPSVLEGVGKLRDYQATIHIDDTVIPIAQKPRRIPFALNEKVRAHLQDLTEKDIIKPVMGPSPWVSPVVVTPKPNGDIRLCVDIRRANQAILRERHPIPTINQILEQLNGSTVFSKIYLRWGSIKSNLTKPHVRSPHLQSTTAYTATSA